MADQVAARAAIAFASWRKGVAIATALTIAGTQNRPACMRRIAIYENAHGPKRAELWRKADVGVRLSTKLRLSGAIGIYATIYKNPLITVLAVCSFAFWAVALIEWIIH